MDTTDQRNKKPRATNWDDQEKEVLRKLVMAKAHIIERKDTTAKTNSAKKIAWKEILSRFNAINPKKRDMTQLLNQWRNYKTRSKHRSSCKTTNGGPPSPSPEDQEESFIINQAISNKSIDAICHDSDNSYIEKESIQNGRMPSPLALIPNEPQSSDDPSTVLSSPTAQPSFKASLQTRDRPGPSGSTTTKKTKRKKLKFACCKTSHEHQIFVLARTARKETMLRDREAHICKMMYDRELHERRKALMDLEETYWRIKIRKLKEKE